MKEKAVSTRFHREFDASGLAKDERLVLGICALDGWVVYLNGKEIKRMNLPDGALDAKTLAQQPFPGEWKHFFFRVEVPSADIQRDRKNKIEVEVHSAAEHGALLSLDLELKTLPPNEPAPSPNPEAKKVLETYRFKHYVPPGTTIPDGYFDGGRRMTLDADEHPESSREILLVDRAHDPELNTAS